MRSWVVRRPGDWQAVMRRVLRPEKKTNTTPDDLGCLSQSSKTGTAFACHFPDRRPRPPLRGGPRSVVSHHQSFPTFPRW